MTKEMSGIVSRRRQYLKAVQLEQRWKRARHKPSEWIRRAVERRFRLQVATALLSSSLQERGWPLFQRFGFAQHSRQSCRMNRKQFDRHQVSVFIIRWIVLLLLVILRWYSTGLLRRSIIIRRSQNRRRPRERPGGIFRPDGRSANEPFSHQCAAAGINAAGRRMLLLLDLISIAAGVEGQGLSSIDGRGDLGPCGDRNGPTAPNVEGNQIRHRIERIVFQSILNGFVNGVGLYDDLRRRKRRNGDGGGSHSIDCLSLRGERGRGGRVYVTH